MKKAVVNKIKSQAAGLPEVQEWRTVPEKRLGKDLPTQLKVSGKGPDGRPISEGRTYDIMIQKSFSVTTDEHVNRMKAAYNKGGADALAKYVGGVHKLHGQQAALIRANAKKDPVVERVLNTGVI